MGNSMKKSQKILLAIIAIFITIGGAVLGVNTFFGQDNINEFITPMQEYKVIEGQIQISTSVPLFGKTGVTSEEFYFNSETSMGRALLKPTGALTLLLDDELDLKFGNNKIFISADLAKELDETIDDNIPEYIAYEIGLDFLSKLSEKLTNANEDLLEINKILDDLGISYTVVKNKKMSIKINKEQFIKIYELLEQQEYLTQEEKMQISELQNQLDRLQRVSFDLAITQQDDYYIIESEIVAKVDLFEVNLDFQLKLSNETDEQKEQLPADYENRELPKNLPLPLAN